MGIFGKFKLQKLTIRAWTRRTRLGLSFRKFVAMYNPTSLSMTHENVFDRLQGINSSGREARYSHSRPQTLTVDLIIDGTGTHSVGLLRLLDKSVTAQVKQFLKIAYRLQGSIHAPNFLRLEWGDGVLQSFDCRLDKVDINYVAFGRDGAPLRAELKAVFIEDIDAKKRASQDGKSSPDLSHTRVVRAGDTLPLLCAEIYGSPAHYLEVARVNRLNNFRALTPGQTLVFPPLER
ncbi:MAG: hypothetical protein R3A51_17730 [Nannocystaceae bacterium]|nr:hypothetical protein [Myxococcales bacterium]